jgi:hypothetical protein
MAVISVLVAAGTSAALCWNEWQLARRLGAVDAAARDLAALAPDARPGTGRAGRPVHLAGEAVAAAPVRDPVLGVVAAALRLDRIAETYQWIERREGSGDNKVLRYERIWSPVPIPSSRFEQRAMHVNPPALPITSGTSFADRVTVGRWALDEAVVAALPATRALRPEGPDETLAAAGLVLRRAGDWLESGSPGSPAVGDVRVRLAAAPEGRVSLVGAVGEDGRTIVSWRGPGGAGLVLAAYGDIPPETLLRTAARGGWRDAWGLRTFGFAGMALAAIFAMPALVAWQGANPAFHGHRRLGTILLLAAGLTAAACVAGWLGARLALALG